MSPNLDIWYADAVSAAAVSGDGSQLAEQAARMIETFPRQPHGYRAAAQAAVRGRNDPASGVRYMKRVFELGYAEHRDYMELAICYARLQDWEKVASLTGDCLAMAPSFLENDAAVHELRGSALKVIGRHRDACAHYHRSYVLAPERQLLRQNMWACYAALGTPGACLEIAKEQVEKFPSISRPYAQLGVSEAHFGHEDVALKHCAKALELDSGTWHSFHYLGRVQCHFGNHAGAIESWSEARKHVHDRTVPANDALLGLDQKAQKYANELRVSYLQAVSSVREVRDPAAAKARCRNILKDPEVATTHVRIVLACALAAEGEFREAEEELDLALMQGTIDRTERDSIEALRLQFRQKQPFSLALSDRRPVYAIPLHFGFRLTRGDIVFVE